MPPSRWHSHRCLFVALLTSWIVSGAHVGSCVLTRAASVENLRLYYFEVMIPADYQDYFFYDQLNFIGAALYLIEPIFDLCGCAGEICQPGAR